MDYMSIFIFLSLHHIGQCIETDSAPIGSEKETNNNMVIASTSLWTNLTRTQYIRGLLSKIITKPNEVPEQLFKPKEIPVFQKTLEPIIGVPKKSNLVNQNIKSNNLRKVPIFEIEGRKYLGIPLQFHPTSSTNTKNETQSNSNLRQDSIEEFYEKGTVYAPQIITKISNSITTKVIPFLPSLQPPLNETSSQEQVIFEENAPFVPITQAQQPPTPKQSQVLHPVLYPLLHQNYQPQGLFPNQQPVLQTLPQYLSPTFKPYNQFLQQNLFNFHNGGTQVQFPIQKQTPLFPFSIPSDFGWQTNTHLPFPRPFWQMPYRYPNSLPYFSYQQPFVPLLQLTEPYNSMPLVTVDDGKYQWVSINFETNGTNSATTTSETQVVTNGDDEAAGIDTSGTYQTHTDENGEAQAHKISSKLIEPVSLIENSYGQGVSSIDINTDADSSHTITVDTSVKKKQGVLLTTIASSQFPEPDSQLQANGIRNKLTIAKASNEKFVDHDELSSESTSNGLVNSNGQLLNQTSSYTSSENKDVDTSHSWLTNDAAILSGKISSDASSLSSIEFPDGTSSEESEVLVSLPKISKGDSFLQPQGISQPNGIHNLNIGAQASSMSQSGEYSVDAEYSSEVNTTAVNESSAQMSSGKEASSKTSADSASSNSKAQQQSTTFSKINSSNRESSTSSHSSSGSEGSSSSSSGN